MKKNKSSKQQKQQLQDIEKVLKQLPELRSNALKFQERLNPSASFHLPPSPWKEISKQEFADCSPFIQEKLKELKRLHFDLKKLFQDLYLFELGRDAFGTGITALIAVNGDEQFTDKRFFDEYEVNHLIKMQYAWSNFCQSVTELEIIA